MLKRIKATARQLREFALNLIGKGADTKTVDPLLIKVMIPRAWFTKKHTCSRIREAKRVFGRFTWQQQEYAIDRGWFPAHWGPTCRYTMGGALTRTKTVHEGNTGTRL